MAGTPPAPQALRVFGGIQPRNETPHSRRRRFYYSASASASAPSRPRPRSSPPSARRPDEVALKSVLDTLIEKDGLTKACWKCSPPFSCSLDTALCRTANRQPTPRFNSVASFPTYIEKGGHFLSDVQYSPCNFPLDPGRQTRVDAMENAKANKEAHQTPVQHCPSSISSCVNDFESNKVRTPT